MTKTKREILTPGEAGPAEGAPAAAGDAEATTAAAATADDLAEYETDDLPEQPSGNQAAAGLPPDMATLVQKMVAEGVAKALAANSKPKKRGEPDKLPTPAEAAAKCEVQVQNGVRPRGVLTTEGWYCHPEMARVKDHGVAHTQLKV